ncbi:MAG: PAS domain S-box protein [Methanomassiliicoccus sp.]|nr:PAS domain S-box protein [Methanomassiliicoccus sp.]
MFGGPNDGGNQIDRFFELSLDMLCIAGFDGFYRRLNRSWEKVLGWTREELMSRPFLEFVHPEDRKGTKEAAEKHLDGRNVMMFENRYMCKDGTYRWISWTAYSIVEESLIYAIARDVTGSKVTEEALRASELKYRKLLEVATEGILVVDRSAAITYANERFLNMLDREAGEVIGQPLTSFIDHQDVPLLLSHLERRMKGEEEQYDIRFVRRDGRRILTMLSAAPIFDEQRHYSGSMSLVTDVTEKRGMERALMEEKERLNVTLRSIGDGVIVTDNDGRILLLNGVAEELTGWSQKDAMSRPLEEVFNIINEVTGERCENPVEKVLRLGRVVGLANHTVLISRDGSRRLLGDSGSPIRDEDGSIIGVVLVFRDVTGEQRMEAEMIKMQRLESIGVLAGGIAHDFNNYLMAIEGNIALARMKLDPGNTATLERLVDAEKASVKARSLTKQLLIFSKGGEPIKKVVDLEGLLLDSLKITLAGSNVQYRLDIEPELWRIEADEGQLGQAFNNIIINAREAMANGGLLEVEARNVRCEQDETRSYPRGEHVGIWFRDHGSGIPIGIVDKIFDPYYSTKPSGRGLGLAIVHSIVKHHDGLITVSAEEGKGTLFEILLPATYSDRKSKHEESRGMTGGHGQLLWMDDEEMIREVGGQLLSFLGYRTEFARDGHEAMAKYRSSMASGEPFGLVILDLTIPGNMGGEETMRHLLEMDPDIRAIVCSGYSNDPVMARYYDYGFRGVLSKPFSLDDLSEIVGKLIRKGR